MRYAVISEDLGIQLLVECEADCPPVHSNADRITQVLVILLDNAYKFTKEGGHVSLYTKHNENEGRRICTGRRRRHRQTGSAPCGSNGSIRREKAHSGGWHRIGAFHRVRGTDIDGRSHPDRQQTRGRHHNFFHVAPARELIAE